MDLQAKLFIHSSLFTVETPHSLQFYAYAEGKNCFRLSTQKMFFKRGLCSELRKKVLVCLQIRWPSLFHLKKNHFYYIHVFSRCILYQIIQWRSYLWFTTSGAVGTCSLAYEDGIWLAPSLFYITSWYIVLCFTILQYYSIKYANNISYFCIVSKLTFLEHYLMVSAFVLYYITCGPSLLYPFILLDCAFGLLLSFFFTSGLLLSNYNLFQISDVVNRLSEYDIYCFVTC
jgi:hypothetical protein